MKIVFVAGPLTTGGDGSREYINQNIENANQYSIALANAGVGFFCAHTHTSLHHSEKGKTAPEEFYRKMDFEFLKRIAGAVLAVPGWEKSFGAKQEVEWAEKHSLRIFYPKNNLDIQEVIEWAKEGESEDI